MSLTSRQVIGLCIHFTAPAHACMQFLYQLISLLTLVYSNTHPHILQFDIPATYPATAPEIELPELEGKTAKMYRGGKICLTIHFKPLWAKNSPHFGVAHALCLGLAPWLAAEVPFLVESGAVVSKS